MERYDYNNLIVNLAAIDEHMWCMPIRLVDWTVHAEHLLRVMCLVRPEQPPTCTECWLILFKNLVEENNTYIMYLILREGRVTNTNFEEKCQQTVAVKENFNDCALAGELQFTCPQQKHLTTPLCRNNRPVISCGWPHLKSNHPEVSLYSVM